MDGSKYNMGLNEKALKWCNNKNANKVVAFTSVNNSEQFKSSNDLLFSSGNEDTSIKKTDNQIASTKISPTESTNSTDFFHKKLDGKTTKKRKSIVTFDVSLSTSTTSFDLLPD
ncbi:hypothetical protein ACI65C_006675 [Semiaphis heraclei]